MQAIILILTVNLRCKAWIEDGRCGCRTSDVRNLLKCRRMKDVNRRIRLTEIQDTGGDVLKRN
jgi:hypothetical protein